MLNMLAGRCKRKKPFSLEGKVLVNGEQVKKKPFQQMTAYVMQVCIHTFDRSFMTYGIGRRYDASPDGAGADSSQRRPQAQGYDVSGAQGARTSCFSMRVDLDLTVPQVDEVIKDIGLSACANTRVGLSGVVRGVSGGERKRTAIACEIVHNPQLVPLSCFPFACIGRSN